MKISPEEAKQSVLALMERDETHMMVQTLEVWVGQARNQFEFAQVLEALKTWPAEVWTGHVECARIHARVACRANDPEALGMLLARFSEVPACLWLYQSWWMLSTRNWRHTGEVLEKVRSFASPWERGFHWRLLGQFQAYSGKPVECWEPCFQEAERHLEGIPLGVCLNIHAWHHWNTGNLPVARRLWMQALTHLRGDPYYTAWVYHSLGMAVLDNHPTEAEQHFQNMHLWSRRKEGQRFQSRAIAGIASSRRLLGELTRAAFAYQEAIRLAEKGKGDLDDLEQARWGLGHCHRLLGHFDLALQEFQKARQAREKSWMLVEVAAIWARLGDVAGALEVLHQAMDLKPREKNLYWVVRAEIQRLQGHPPMEALQNVQFRGAGLSEEALFFPELFQEALVLGFPAVEALQVVTNHVEVWAAGVLKVRVNGREVPLDARGFPGLMLVFLLEAGGRATTEQLAELIFDERQTGKKVRQTVWNHIEKLREVLGWENSIISQGRVYQLDPAATWGYDIPQLLREGKPIRAFLMGHYQRWVHDKQQEYEVLE